MPINKIKSWKWATGILLFILLSVIFKPYCIAEGEDKVLEAIQFRIKGYIYQRQGNFTSALEYYKKAITVNPFYACAHNDLGILYEQKGQLQKAEQEYTTALKLDPTYTSPYTNLALLYERLGRFEDAAFYWNGRASLGNPEDTWTQNARMRLEELNTILKEEKDAKDKKLRRSTKKAAKKADAYLEDKIKQRRRAEKERRRAKRIKRRHKASEEKKKALKLAEEYSADIEEEAGRNYKRAGLYYKEGLKFFRRSEYADALGKFQQALETYPEHKMAARYITITEKKLEDQELKSAREKERLYERAKNYYDAKKYDAALKVLSELKSIDPHYSGANTLLGRIEKAMVQEETERFLSQREKDSYGKVEADNSALTPLAAGKTRSEMLERYKEERRKRLHVEDIEFEDRLPRRELRKKRAHLERQKIEDGKKGRIIDAKARRRADRRAAKEARLKAAKERRERIKESRKRARLERRTRTEKDIRQAAKEVYKDKRKEEITMSKADKYIGIGNKYLLSRKYKYAIAKYKTAQKIAPAYPGIDKLIANAEMEKRLFEQEKQQKAQVARHLKEQERQRKEKEKKFKRIEGYLKKAEQYLVNKKYNLAIHQYKLIQQIEPGYPNIDNMIKMAEEKKAGKAGVKKAKPEEAKVRKPEPVAASKSESYRERRRARREAALQRMEAKRQEAKRKREKRLEEAKKRKEARLEAARKREEKKLQEKRRREENLQKRKLQAESLKKQRQARITANRLASAERYMEKGRFDAAIAQYERIKKSDPSYPDIDAFIQQARDAKIRNMEGSAQKINLKAAEGHFRKGEKLYLNGEYDRATRYFELALSSNPNHAEAQRLLRYCMRRLKAKPYRPLEQSVERITRPQMPETIAVTPEVEIRTQAEAATETKPVPPVTTTDDIDNKYVVLGVVSHRATTSDLDAFNKELLKKAKSMGGDHVIQIRYFQHENYFYGYGTAVKEKN